MNVLVSGIEDLLARTKATSLSPPKCQLPDFFASYLIVIATIIISGHALVPRLVVLPQSFCVIPTLE